MSESRDRFNGYRLEARNWASTTTTKSYNCSGFALGACAGLESTDLIHNNGSAQHISSKLSSMQDTVGRPHRYNAIVHERIHPCVFIVPSGDKEVDVLPPLYPAWINTTEKRAYRQECSGGAFTLSPEVFQSSYPNYAWPEPELPALDWTGLVMKVGNSLDGHITTRSNILVTIGEGLTTIRMLKNPLKTLRALTSSKTIKQVVKGAADLRLEYKYGWKQIVRDLFTFSNVYNNVTNHMKYLSENKGRYRSVSASQVDEVNPNTFHGMNVNELEMNFHFTSYKRTARVSCMSLLDEAIASHDRSYWTLRALGVNKIVEAAWDLVPFSFVLDWLVNFERIFASSRTAYNFHKIKMLGYSTKKIWKYRPYLGVQFSDLYDNRPGIQKEWKGPEQIVRSVYTRTPGFPPDGETTGIFNTLSKTNLADGAALILQRI